MRELAGELERKKNFEEERRKKKEEMPEREREGNVYFNERGERSVIILFIYLFIYLPLSCNAHLKHFS